ncbi:MAG: hypothetical protein HYY78_13240 [Betaproteobacteria bacterium]|nr:hypothetical protein [Betaproteobacteria bacterium]
MAPTAQMTETASTPALASVIVLKIHEFTRRPVAEQARLKARLEELVAAAIRPLAAADRAVLDTPDGAAVVVLGGPRAALELAERAQVAAADLPLCIGANHGPVRPASDASRGTGLVGDGLAESMTLAGVATPGRFLASRAFHDALEAHAPGRAADLGPAGVFTDPNVRAHELYVLDPRASRARRLRLAITGALSVAVIIGLGIAARIYLNEAAARPAVIVFEIKPRGDIVIDGEVMGRSPPLTQLEVSPGPHTIEVRNSANPPLTLDVNLEPEQKMTIRHAFAAPKPAAPRSKSAGDYLRDWRRQLGL